MVDPGIIIKRHSNNLKLCVHTYNPVEQTHNKNKADNWAGAQSLFICCNGWQIHCAVGEVGLESPHTPATLQIIKKMWQSSSQKENESTPHMAARFSVPIGLCGGGELLLHKCPM